jgi:hypothetical protein
MQTAVQWLDRWFRDNPEATHEEGNKALEQAKEMEKENTIAYGYRCIGEIDSELGDLIYHKVPEEVYNEMYGIVNN